MDSHSKCIRHKLEVVANVGGEGLGPNMTIVMLVHALHRSSLGMSCRGLNRGKINMTSLSN